MSEQTQATATEGQNTQAEAPKTEQQAQVEGSPAKTEQQPGKEPVEGKVDEGKQPDKKTDENAAEGASEGNGETYDARGDEALGKVYSAFTELGLTPAVAEAAFMEAVKSNDLNKVNRQALVDALGSEAKADMAIAQATVYYNQRETAARHVEKLFNEVAGGDGKWAPVKNWIEAKANIDPAFKAEVAELRGMVGKSDAQTKFVAQELMKKFAADPHTKSDAKLEIGNQLDVSNNQLLGRKEFSAQFQAAQKKGDVNEMNNLLARRKVSRAAGIE